MVAVRSQPSPTHKTFMLWSLDTHTNTHVLVTFKFERERERERDERESEGVRNE